jgi:small subunit ribosomal protein S15
MPLTKDRTLAIVTEYGKNDKDSGNSEVQVALLTERITQLTEHAKANTKDHHSRHGLLKLVGQRKSMLDFLKKEDVEKYRALIKKLHIRK